MNTKCLCIIIEYDIMLTFDNVENLIFQFHIQWEVPSLFFDIISQKLIGIFKKKNV